MKFTAELISTPDRQSNGIYAVIRCDMRHPEIEERIGYEQGITRNVLRDHEFTVFENTAVEGLRKCLQEVERKVMAERKMRAKTREEMFGEIMQKLSEPREP